MTKIFTFWEPRENIHGYLDLCIKTWKKNLPNYEIVILDYSNLYDWIDKDTFNNILFDKNYFTIAMIADAIRVAVLYKHGGIWLDTDTIVTKDFDYLKREKEKTELLLTADVKIDAYHVGFLWATKNSKILGEWLKLIKKKINEYSKLTLFGWKLKIKGYSLIHNKAKKKEYKKKIATRYDDCCRFGNDIAKIIIPGKPENEILCLDKWKVGFPEFKYINDEDYAPNKYKKLFFFENKNFDVNKIIEDDEIILLHNSHTPWEYKSLSEEKILSDDNLVMSRLLRKILL